MKRIDNIYKDKLTWKCDEDVNVETIVNCILKFLIPNTHNDTNVYNTSNGIGTNDCSKIKCKEHIQMTSCTPCTPTIKKISRSQQLMEDISECQDEHTHNHHIYEKEDLDDKDYYSFVESQSKQLVKEDYQDYRIRNHKNTGCRTYETPNYQGHAYDKHRGGVYSRTYVTTPDLEKNKAKRGGDGLYRHVDGRIMQMMHLDGTITLVSTEAELLHYMRYYNDNN